MAIRTGSVLERLCANVDKQRRRVARAEGRVQELRQQWAAAHWSKQREIAAKGFMARQVLENARADLAAAESALKAEEDRLLQPDTFLRFA